jgi:calcineurin-like phosphoesterase family protein
MTRIFINSIAVVSGIAALALTAPRIAEASPFSDHFSTDTSANYTLTDTVRSGGSFAVSGGTLNLTSGESNTADVFHDTARLQAGERVRVTVPVGTENDFYLTVSSINRNPGTGTEDGIRWQVLNAGTLRSRTYRDGVGSNIDYAGPGASWTGDLTLYLYRDANTSYRVGYDVGGGIVILDTITLSETASDTGLFVGVEGWDAATRTFAHLVIEEINPKVDESAFSIAAVADPQYADTQPRGAREPGEGIARLTHAVAQWNQRDLDWGVMVGDIIDWDDIDYGKFPQETITLEPKGWKHTRAILDVWDTLNIPKYIVLGNHDYYVPFKDADGLSKPASVYRAFGFKDKAYYDFKHKGFRFVVLDGDISPLNYDPESEAYQNAKAYYEAVQGPQKTWWNAGISQEQMTWLKGILDTAQEAKEPTVIMCHYPIHEPIMNHSLLNSREMLTLLDTYPNVVMWLNGHNHKGDYAKVGNRHHLNLKGMQNEGENWYQMDFTSNQIAVYQAENLDTPKYELDIVRP